MDSKTTGAERAEKLITAQDVSELSDKLEAWSKTLSPAEQALLALIMSRAKATEPTPPGSGRANAATTKEAAAPKVGLSAAQTRAWLTPWAVNKNLSFAGTIQAGDAFAKDTGPSWVNSPRQKISIFEEQE